MDLSQVEVQSDNGSEFVSNSPDLSRQSAFEKAIDQARSTLNRIPPRACTWQSEVERANGIIEYELLEVERWQSKSELVAKTTAWEYYFNRIRPNFPPAAGQIPLEVHKTRCKRGVPPEPDTLSAPPSAGSAHEKGRHLIQDR